MTTLLFVVLCALVMWYYDNRPETIYVLGSWRVSGHTVSIQFCTRQFTLGFGGTFEHENTLFLMAGCFVVCVQFDRTDYNSYQASVERTLAAGAA